MQHADFHTLADNAEAMIAETPAWAAGAEAIEDISDVYAEATHHDAICTAFMEYEDDTCEAPGNDPSDGDVHYLRPVMLGVVVETERRSVYLTNREFRAILGAETFDRLMDHMDACAREVAQ